MHSPALGKRRLRPRAACLGHGSQLLHELEANTIADALAALTLAAHNRRRTATAAATIKTTPNAVASNAAGVAAEIVSNYCS